MVNQTTVTNISSCVQVRDIERGAEKKVVIYLIPVKDMDLDHEIVDIDYDDLNEKLEVLDGVAINQFYIPTLAIKTMITQCDL